jgi:leucyl aminopeptidase
MLAADVTVVRTVPRTAEAFGVAVRPTGSVPRQLGLSRASLEKLGFEGKVGQGLLIPTREGATVIAVGVGEAPTTNELRDAAATFARVANRFEHLATNLVDGSADPSAAAQAVVEGAVLARFRYEGAKAATAGLPDLSSLALVVAAKSDKAASVGALRGSVTARAGCLARQLAELPPNDLTARKIAAMAVDLGAAHGFGVEVFDRDQLAVLGCGGMLGVNAGSTEPPRMIKLTYSPRGAKAHIALVGKGVMYDSGGISLKPTNPMSAMMKMDMSGAGAVLAAMTTLAELGCRNKVSAWLMCTDNMPSGAAVKLGDVLTFRNGKTAEIHNTDAEGRLVLADGLSLAAEAEPDAIIDIATLTGAALAALGPDIAAVVGSNADLVDKVRASAEATDEPVWEMPLSRDRYRKLIDSNVADMKNVGGPYAGTITASIFLSEFVGDVPWAHLDIAGPMNADSANGWKTKGATGFGARLLVDLAMSYTK